VASPSVRDSFIRYTSPVYPGASSRLVQDGSPSCGRLSLADARPQAREHLADPVKGIDPVRPRRGLQAPRRPPDRGLRGSRSLPVILCGMTHRVGSKGQVVIPKAFREAVNIEPGDEVTFSRDGNAIRVERLASPDALMGRLAGHRLVKALEEDRRAERRR
jgi:AbrB family looped-hinge helix DNA binding protein